MGNHCINLICEKCGEEYCPKCDVSCNCPSLKSSKFRQCVFLRANPKDEGKTYYEVMKLKGYSIIFRKWDILIIRSTFLYYP